MVATRGDAGTDPIPASGTKPPDHDVSDPGASNIRASFRGYTTTRSFLAVKRHGTVTDRTITLALVQTNCDPEKSANAQWRCCRRERRGVDIP